MRVTFPAKAYLNYTVTVTDENAVTHSATVTTEYRSDYTATALVPVTDSSASTTLSGTAYVTITATPKSSLYAAQTFQTAVTVDVIAAPFAVNANRYNEDADGLYNDIHIALSGTDGVENLALSYVNASTGSSATTVALPTEATDGIYYVTVKDLAEGIYLFTATGTYNGVTYTASDDVTVDEAVVDASNLSLTVPYTSSASSTRYLNVWDIIDDAEETLSNYTYTLYRAAYTQVNTGTTAYYTVGDYTNVGTVTLFEYAGDTYVGELTDSSLEAGMYSYYVEKYDSVTKTSAKVFLTTTVTDSSYSYYPSIYTSDSTISYGSATVTWATGTTETIAASARSGSTTTINFALTTSNYSTATNVTSLSGLTVSLYRAQRYNASSYSTINDYEENFTLVSSTPTAVTASGTYVYTTGGTSYQLTDYPVYYSFVDSQSSTYNDYDYVIIVTDGDGNKFYSDIFTVD